MTGSHNGTTEEDLAIKTLSVKLPDRLDARLAAAARRRKTSKSTVVRKAVEAALREGGTPPRGSALELARDLVGCLAGPDDLSYNKKHMKNYGR